MKKIAHLLSSPPRAVIAVKPKGKASLVYSCMQTIDCEQSLFGQSRLSSAGLEIAN